ncbi:hypothetical protein Ndes2437B_g06760 [Nannochloris sp. 'desiccata']
MGALQEVTLCKEDGDLFKIVLNSSNATTLVSIFDGGAVEDEIDWRLSCQVSFDPMWLENGCLHFLLAIVALKLKEGYALTGNIVYSKLDGYGGYHSSQNAALESKNYANQGDFSRREQKGGTDILELAPYFYYPINEAAKRLKICPTVLKKICRKHGLRRWPHRKLQSIERALEKLHLMIVVCQDDSATHIPSLLTRIEELESERNALCFHNVKK